MLSLSVRFAQAENEEIYKRHKCLLDGDWISAIFWYGIKIEVALFFTRYGIKYYNRFELFQYH